MNKIIPSIIAHRGASFDAPENTLASVSLAWERDADAVEVDVRLTTDGRIVVFHDADLSRLCRVNKKIDGLTFDQLLQYDVGKWKGDEWAGEKIPLLEDVLKTVPANKRTIIEIKCGAEIIPELKKVIDKSSLHPDQIEFIGFDIELIGEIKKQFPENKALGLWELKEDREKSIFYPSAEEIISKAKQLGLDGIDINACCGVIDHLEKRLDNMIALR